MTAVWTGLVAVLGTLAGSVTTGLLARGAARATAAETRREARRAAILAAVSDLAAALAAHRRAMWLRGQHRLDGADPRVVAEARAASHETRDAVTAPLVRVTVLAPRLAGTAQLAAQAAYDLRDAADVDTLSALREAALAATGRLVADASRIVDCLHREEWPCGTTSPSRPAPSSSA